MSHIKDRLIQLKNEVENTGNGAYFSKNNISKIVELLLADLEQDEKENGWIPVSERLPEPGKDVAVLLKGFIPAIGRYEVIRDGIGAFVVPGQIETPVEFRLPVTAWTPLPDARRDRK